ncbi:MAG: DUF4271 domain-containing protein [Bacteroidales bacterium]|nr:DUF4271 domain-containing protein [Bacteroidales bacterium]
MYFFAQLSLLIVLMAQVPFSEVPDSRETMLPEDLVTAMPADTTAPAELLNGDSFFGSPHKLPVFDTLDGVAVEDAGLMHDWVLWVFLAALFLLAVTGYFYPNRLKQVIKAVLGIRFFLQLNKDAEFFKHPASYLLSVIFILALSMLVFQSLLHTGRTGLFHEMPLYLQFAGIAGFWLLFYCGKALFVWFLAWLFDTRLASRIYLENIFVFNIVNGLLLLPLVFYNAYTPSIQALNVMWGLLVLSNVYKHLRGAFLSHKDSGFSMYYLFLYLCGVEIIPLLLLGKAVTVYLPAP